MAQYLFEDSFIMDKEKMYDFINLSKEEFLFSYSYLTEREYDVTKEYFDYLISLVNRKEDKINHKGDKNMVKNNTYKTSGHFGLWSIIDFKRINDKVYCLLENNSLGDETPCVVVDGSEVKIIKRKIGAVPEFQKEICETYDGLLFALNENEIITNDEMEFLENGGEECDPVKKCPKCGRNLYPSQIDGYTYQCFHCDEDFYDIEVK